MSNPAVVQIVSTFDSSSLREPLLRSPLFNAFAEQVQVTPSAGLTEYMLSPPQESEDITGTIVLIRLEDWLRDASQSVPSPITDATARQQLRQHMDAFLSQLGVLALRGRPVWLMTCPSAGWVANQHKIVVLCRTLTNLLALRVRNLHQVQLLSCPAELSDESLIDRDSDQTSHSPFRPAGWTQLGESLAQQVPQSLTREQPASVLTGFGSPELAAFLAGLEVSVGIAPATEADQEDVGRILRSAASFSLTGENPTMSDAEAAALVVSRTCYVVKVTDRMSNYGTSGIVTAGPDGDSLAVRAMSLSCTVLGKQVEYALLNGLAHLAASRSLSKIRFNYKPSARNQPTLAFLTAAIGVDIEKEFVLPVNDVEDRIQRTAPAPGTWTVTIG